MAKLKWIWDWHVEITIGLYGWMPVIWFDWTQRTLPPWSKRAAAISCQCEACLTSGPHASDCAVHRGPALPVGPCDCNDK